MPLASNDLTTENKSVVINGNNTDNDTLIKCHVLSV